MANYVVGDLQGCLQPLKALLDFVDFNPGIDSLWLAGDIVNRGPESLACIEFLQQNAQCMQMVLGNHDLHLLAILFSVRQASKKDTLSAILNHPQRNKIKQFLLAQPLVYTNSTKDQWMSHAGLPFNISAEQALSLSGELQSQLAKEPLLYFQNMYGDAPSCFEKTLSGMPRLRCITNLFTRMRFVNTDNAELEFNSKSGLKHQQDGLLPWYQMQRQHKFTGKWYFGHWAALEAKPVHDQFIATDAGFVWGGNMLLINQQTQQRFYCDQKLTVTME